MNILVPDKWLREFLETDATPKQIQECLSLCGPSVEKISGTAENLVYEIEITTNRIDCVSVYGIAREAYAILKRFGFKTELKHPKFPDPSVPDRSLPISIRDPQKICRRILGVIMTVNNNRKTPVHMVNRLQLCGIRSLNVLVDITNYVMLELGHPSHVFDYDRIKTADFLIRKSKEGEKVVTLDGKKYLLGSGDVVIDDGTGRIIDLPGIMGTQNSVVTKDTKRILFFIESNDPVLIRKTSIKYGIRTMAASINEKQPDPYLAKDALLRGIDLYANLAEGKVAGKITDIFPDPPEQKTVSLDYGFINRKIGVSIPKKDVSSILESLSFKVQSKDNILEVKPPTYRSSEINIPEDIVEEVVRIWGYHNMPSVLMEGGIPQRNTDYRLDLELNIKKMLKFWGFTELYNYSFCSSQLLEKANLDPAKHLSLQNPLTPDTEFLRTSIIPSVLQCIVDNQDLKIPADYFEMAMTYIPEKSVSELPQENPYLVLASQKDFSFLKGIVEGLFAEFGILKYRQSVLQKWHYGHPGKSVEFSVSSGGKEITAAKIGIIHPDIKSSFGLKNDLVIAELPVNILCNLFDASKKFTPIPVHTPSTHTFTFTGFGETHITDVFDHIFSLSDLVTEINFDSEYLDSRTFTVTFQPKDRNLTTQDIKKVRNLILDSLKKKFCLYLKI